ncbi:hypothetical protein ACIQFP_10535 [Nocardiopsis alba]|uniref:deoxynucleotide monophosphate kinase family protein n=1 Tax=Nocardiopsis alba TaxID=53437 RepID=UPI003804B82A
MRDIALMGYSRSGKDTAAAHLVGTYGYTRVAFADPVRESLLALDPYITADMSGRLVRLSALVDRIGWESAKEAVPEVRALLQRHGTEAVRGVLGEDAWVDIARQKVARAWRSTPRTPVIITDCRFPNEAHTLRAWGFLRVWVERPGREPLNGHASETSLGPADADVVLRNGGSPDDLATQISELAGATYRDA